MRELDKEFDSNPTFFTDIHCHCLAGLDDGPVDTRESLNLCRSLAADGVRQVIATTHQLGRYDGLNQAEQIRDAVRQLNQKLQDERISLEVYPGGEIRVDERICELLSQDKVLTLADNGRYILIEFPHNIFFDIEPLLIDLESMGITVVISHPESNNALLKQLPLVSKWGVYLQVDAASVVGDFGVSVQKSAWALLESGLTNFIGTDSHNITTRAPRMSLAFGTITNRLGEKIARDVCVDNPLKVLEGKEFFKLQISGNLKNDRS